MPHAIGQRWLSDNESELGIGTLVALDARTVTLDYPATEERRVYSKSDAPITRLQFAENEIIRHREGWEIKITRLDTINQVTCYFGIRTDDGEESVMIETELSDTIVINKPQDRLFAGQLDRLEQFNLRYQCLANRSRLQSSPLRGLNGARIGLIPHQLHIAKEAGQRFAPRLLLADEVGLGKTIEAGLILHQQLLTERAKRVLILVPESLQHQWLVEMLRRFNIQVSLFDEDRINEGLNDAVNPFESEQIVLCSQRLMIKKRIHDAAVEAEWDLLVVDEAHHLTWEDGKPGRDYQRVAALAEQTPGLLLLTATPDQLGHEGHFARLQLLDPNRFHDYQQFIEEEQSYRQVAEAANTLLDEQSLTAEQQTLLSELLNERDIEPLLRTIQDSSSNEEVRQQAKNELLEQLLDRHGTSRVLFRNTRAAISGFPERHLHTYQLAMPAAYNTAIKLTASPDPSKRLIQLLSPESCYSDLEGSSEAWLAIDPRVDWLLEQLTELKPHKVLLICSQKRTVLQLAETLRERTGMQVSSFHEDMTIVERDRAAAHFSDDEEGSQILLCSEIGSEGRNFQFAHHLVLFDLPLNPDLLEQRIGRLDRIGQQHDIQIHIPYFAQTAQQRLLDWLHQGLDAIEHTLSFGKKLFDQYESDLTEGLLQNLDESQWQQLLDQTKARRLELMAELESGRDRLLELGSGGRGQTQSLIESIAKLDDDIELPQFMLKLWDVYGVNQDDKGRNCIVLKPTEQMLGSDLQGLPEDGATITFDRETALSREEVQFLSWDHPMVSGAVDAILTMPTGSANVAVLSNRALPAGSYMLQLLYTVHAPAPGSLQLGRFLPAPTIRVMLDRHGNNLANNVSFEQIGEQLSPIGRHTATKLVAALRQQLPELINKAEGVAGLQAETLSQQAQQQADEYFRRELDRLNALKAVNPSVRDDELEHLEQQAKQVQQVLTQAQLQLDAVQLIVVNHG